MSYPLSQKPQAATRQLPVARPRDHGDGSAARLRASSPPRSQSESRLQAAVGRPDVGADPYADPPCTD